MKKKSIIIYLCLLMLIIKPYVDINYSNESNNFMNPYSLGYTTGACASHPNSWYVPYDDSYHYIRCTTCGDKMIFGAHGNMQAMIDANYAAGSWWGPGLTCDDCGYTYSSGSTGNTGTSGKGDSHVHDYTDSYSNINSSQHYAYCSCGDSISEDHLMVYCCSGGDYCKKCNYINHTHSSHSHIYNDYRDTGSDLIHSIYCYSGDSSYITDSHEYVTCCANGSKCTQCGHKNHSSCYTHSHSFEYIRVNSEEHRKNCSSCTYSVLEDHEFQVMVGYKYCKQCRYRENTTEAHTCLYLYVKYSDSQHIKSCSGCATYSYENHTMEYCCSMGKACSKCGYADHNSCHVHKFNRGYQMISSQEHRVYCEDTTCSLSQLQGHSMSTAQACGYTYCTKNCGYSSGAHSYTSKYQTYGSSGHNAYCACGVNQKQEHTLVTLSCGYSYCEKNCGYFSGNHNYINYVNNGSTGHTVRCTCGASITEQHTLSTLRCGYAYCNAGCGYEVNAHDYTYRYEKYNKNIHNAYCICGSYISKEHNFINCCYEGKICANCGEKDHVSCHIHTYDVAYEELDSQYHKAYCRCNLYTNEQHILVACCANGSKCSKCGYKDHTICLSSHTEHTFSYEDYGNPDTHKAICIYTGCTYSVLDEHIMISCCANGSKCSRCGYKDHDENVINCEHEYLYIDYNSTIDHKVICSKCSKDLGRESHQEVYCCEGGKKCGKCGYKYGHTCVGTHVHDYTAVYIIKDATLHKSYCICNLYIEEEHEIVAGECTKCGYAENFISGIAGGTANSPVIPEGAIPVKWDETQSSWIVTDVYDYEWYDYSNNKWANITLRDGLEIEAGNAVTGTIEELKGKKVRTTGSMFVWIPRYTYRNNGNGDVSIYFSDGILDNTNNKYIVSPAFYYGQYLGGNPNDNLNYGDKKGKNNDLAGIWIGKFIASKDNNHVNVKAEKNIYTSDFNTLFNDGKSMRSDSSYGFESNRIFTHMIKPSEWASVGYLTAAVGEIPFINNTMKTGYSGNSSNASSSETSHLWKTLKGGMASTTHNATGVFDMNGGVNEYVAGYVTVDGATTVTGEATLARSLNDVDKIDVSTAKTIGVAGFSNYKLGLTDVMNWNDDEFVLPTVSASILTRGGNYTQQEKAGIYSLNSSVESDVFGFRPVIVVLGATEQDNFALFETETTVTSGGTAIINLHFTTEQGNWKLGKNLNQLFVPDANTGKRVIDMYITEDNDLSEVKYELNQNIVSIVKNGVQMTANEVATITENTTFPAGAYNIKIAIGGVVNGVPIFENGKGYKVKLGGIALTKSTGDLLNIVGAELNIVKINVVGVN